MLRHNCPACTSSSYTTLVREPYTSTDLLAYMKRYYHREEDETRRWLDGVDYEVRECKNCGLCWQFFYPGLELAATLYDQWIDGDASRENDLRRPSLRGYEPILQEVVALAGYLERKVPLHKIRVLDYGMGWGSWLRMARAFGLDAYGYEVSRTRIEHASSLGIPCLGDNDLAGLRFHIINMEQVLEHLPDPADVVQRLLPLLTDDGILKIGVPNGSGTAASLRARGTSDLTSPAFTAIQPLEHVNSFTPTALRRMAEFAGLRARREPILKQLSLICSSSPYSIARSIGRPLVRGVLGAGTSLVFSR